MADTGNYLVAEPVVVRTAGLPATVLTDLAWPLGWQAAHRVLADRDRLLADGRKLADALEEVIGAGVDPADRPTLIGLRRALFATRRPAAKECRALAALPAGLAGEIVNWIARVPRADDELAAVADAQARDAETAAPTLLRLAGQPEFARALAQAAPSLFDETLRWAADPARVPRNKTLRALAKYLSRAAAKTSPYSTFTVNGTALFAAAGPAVLIPAGTPVRSVAEFDRVLLGHFANQLATRPDLAESLPLRVNPSLHVTDESMRFLSRRPREAIAAVPRTAALSAVLAALAELSASKGMAVRADVTDLLAQRTGLPSAKLAAFLTGLCDRGLLEVCAPIGDQSRHPLADLAAWLRKEGTATDHATAERLDRLSAVVCDPAPIDQPEAHERWQDTVVGLSSELAEAVGTPLPPRREIRRSIFHENAVHRSAELRCAEPAWRPALDDLDVVRRWLAVHDPFLPARVALDDAFERWFGPDAVVPVLDVHRRVQEALGAVGPDEDDDVREHLRSGYPSAPAALARSRSARLRRLHALLGDSLSELDSDGADVARVDPARLAELGRAWPTWVRTPPSVTCYVQPVGTGTGPIGLVVNVVTGGHGRGRGRWSRIVDQAGVPAGARPAEPGGDWVLAEISGAFESALDLATPLVPYEIDYPYTASSRPADERIALGELVVERDPAGGTLRLRCPRLDTTVYPVHSGMMSDLLLPPLARLLITAFGSGYVRHPSWPIGSTLDETDRPADRLPRIEVGRVVVQRARWNFAAADVPTKAKGESAAAHLLRLVSWLRETGVPRRCFARLLPAEADWGERAFDKSRKPVFVDFASGWLVAVLENMLSGWEGVVTFEEALPDPLGQERVTECLVELTGEDR